MSSIPYCRRILVVTALLALITVPMASARTVDTPSVGLLHDGWLGAAVQWVEDLVGLRQPSHHSGHPGAKAPQIKSDPTTMTTSGGSCIDPTGHPRPTGCL